MTHSTSILEVHGILNYPKSQGNRFLSEFADQVAMNSFEKRMLLAGINSLEKLDEQEADCAYEVGIKRLSLKELSKYLARLGV